MKFLVCYTWKEANEISWYNVKKINFNDLIITPEKKAEILEKLLPKCGQYI